MKHRFSLSDQWLLLPFFSGFLAFAVITGGAIIRPANTDWLMGGDPAQYWIGWQFFRYTPLFQWPLGANPDYGMSLSSSIVYTDSIPLLAFFFKLFNKILPNTFQYFGLWILVCFTLQSYFAWRLLSLFTHDKWLPLIGSMFFILAPVYLFRLISHFSLFAQWVLIAGLYFYFRKHFSILSWIILLAVTTLIHPYLLAMLLGIWFADLIQRLWLTQTGINKTIFYFFSVSISVIIVSWAVGYFIVGNSIGADGFGIYRLNLLSVVNPDDMWEKWSMLLPGQNNTTGDYEGFNYLGLGMILLGIFATYKFLKDGNIKFSIRIIPILIISIIFILYAISNHIAFGNHEIFLYKTPLIFLPITNAFRCSGRFFWPVYYVIYISIFYVLFTRIRPNAAIVLCILMLCLQISDSLDIWRMFRNRFAHVPVWVSPMSSPVWSDIAKKYKQIIVVFPSNKPSNWIPLSQFAATHHMTINTGYFARVNAAKEQEAKNTIITTFERRVLNPNAVYIFNDDKFWNYASLKIASSDFSGVLDGFYIIAPNFKSVSNYGSK